MSREDSSSDLASFHDHMTPDEVTQWLAARLARRPESSDVYAAAKDFYQAGAYAKCARCLELYMALPGVEVAGHHLLGYAYFMTGQLERAREQLVHTVNGGYDSDWQLLTEICAELDGAGADGGAAAKRGARDGGSSGAGGASMRGADGAADGATVSAPLVVFGAEAFD